MFGALVIVTGPTVITPLLRRIRVRRKVATVLEAEGVLIDAIGAILAVVALEVAISKSDSAPSASPTRRSPSPPGISCRASVSASCSGRWAAR
jgi:NhaP-type Na+/H+ or K+/H+ antiporter